MGFGRQGFGITGFGSFPVLDNTQPIYPARYRMFDVGDIPDATQSYVTCVDTCRAGVEDQDGLPDPAQSTVEVYRGGA